MKIVDLSLYNEVVQIKKPSEIFIGFIKKNWKYSLVDYTADCIESIPFSIFDKAICGLLTADSQLSYTQIGEILGLNIFDDPENGKYCDHAEEELLNNALNEMLEYEMIARSKFDASYYRLTEIGRGYYENRKKLRTRYNVIFRLFFDWTTGEHSKAKAIFEKADTGKIVSDKIYKQMSDESLLKTFMYEQQPEIYNEEGNSFSNLRINKALNVDYPIYICLLFDVVVASYRIVAIDPYSDSNDYFNKSLESNEKLNDGCFKGILTNCSRSISAKSTEQKEYEGQVRVLCDNIEGKTSKEKSQIIEDFNSSNTLFEEEYFWQHLEELLDTNTKKIYLFVEYLSTDIMDILSNISYKHHDIYFYITYSKADHKLDEFQHNVFFIESNTSKYQVACYCNEDCVFEYHSFIHTFGSMNYSSNVIVKRNSSQFDVKEIEGKFAKALIPNIIKYVDSKLKPKEFKPSIESIERLEGYINIIDQFGYWTDKMGFTTQVALIKVKQNKILKKVKMLHEESLYNAIQDILSAVEISQIRKIERIADLKKKILDIWQETKEDYDKVKPIISGLNDAINERERFIKDTLISKLFVFDTNVFLDDPHILSKVKYQDHVILAARVTEELNKHKTNKDSNVAKNAQLAIKLIGNERRKDNGHLHFERAKLDLLPHEFSKRDADNMILAVALNHINENICLVTSDENFLQKSATVEIPCLSLDEFYHFIEKRESDRKADIEEAKKQQLSKSRSNNHIR